MKTPRTAAVAVSLALLGALAACGGESDSPAPEVASDAPAPTHTDVDASFAQLMTVHHQTAEEMSGLAEINGGSQDIKDLAVNITDVRDTEVDAMTWWLKVWGEESAASAEANGLDYTSMQMDGLSPEEVMYQLGGLSGAEFDQRYLELMIVHHKNANNAAQKEIRDGANGDAIRLAEAIVATQNEEITTMETMQTALTGF
ncbi:DUF305 domain-containing protein [Sanguibacter antarcticus]|uniref:Uncharacterized protein (DUF305 family) n=1 Tax=Sanguibacter antarcticus TaxID=372484 RepID=A0A2A9E8E3_9MICO|nr:DUF305 domain-containing protein [Sanguibacter antarcticus]PFG34916.1 uncharacterized protein (DUF305 family) [Sanguibacter antarcticus]